MNLAANIAGLRKKRGLTQAQLAEALHITPAAVSKWVTGASVPDLETLVALADYFRVSMDDLLGRALKRSRSVLFAPEEDVRKMAIRLLNLYHHQILGVARSLEELETVLAQIEERGEQVDTLLVAFVHYAFNTQVFLALGKLKERYHYGALCGGSAETIGQLEKTLRISFE